MKPKEFVRHTQWIDRTGKSICDGMTQEFGVSMFDVLYPLFIISGLGLFIWILYRWEDIKDRIKRK